MSSDLLTVSEATSEVRERLQSVGFPGSDIDDLARQVAVLSGPQGAMRGKRGLVLGKRVIRNDDLQVFDIVFKSLEAVIAAGWVTDKAFWAAAAGILVGIGRICHRLANKSAYLDIESISLLLLLKKNPSGLSIEEICESVNLPKFTHLVGPEDIHRALDRLTKVALADGSVIALVVTDGRGFWTASGV
jgi:hypothetical protein